MNFIVTASQAGREVVFERGSLLAAHQQALMLRASGMDSVRVTDCRGRAVHPAGEEQPSTPASRLRIQRQPAPLPRPALGY